MKMTVLIAAGALILFESHAYAQQCLPVHPPLNDLGAPPGLPGPPPILNPPPPPITNPGPPPIDLASAKAGLCIPIIPPTLTTPAVPSGDCATIPGTTIQAGAGCSACSSAPALRNPHDPVNYGGSLSAALAAGGDVYFAHPGIYTISSSVWVPQGVNIECAPGVTLSYPVVGAGHDNAALWLQGGDGVYGCDFQGANQTRLNGAGSGGNYGTYLIWVEGSGNRVECNTFEHAVGNAAVGTYPGPSSTSNSQLDFENNTCSGDPLYCVVFDAQSSGSIEAHNLAIDSSIGSEWDGCPTGAGGTGTIGSVVVAQNAVITHQGNCASLGQSGCVAPEIAGEAYPDGCDYSGETVTANYVGGDVAGYVGMHDNSNSAYWAHVFGNTLGPNASCRLGIGC